MPDQHSKNLFERIKPTKRLFIVNIELSWLFCLLAIGTRYVRDTNLANTVLLFALLGSIINMLFAYVIQKNDQAHLFYFLVASGGLSVISITYISAFGMIGWDISTLLIFWRLFIPCVMILMYIYYKELSDEFLKKNAKVENSKYLWDPGFDIYAQANAKYGKPANLIRNVIGPFAPALGMAFSRNYQGQQEAQILGLVMMSMGLMLNVGYIRHFVLGLKFLDWQKKFKSKIVISEQ